MTDVLTVSGLLTEKDVKRLTRLTRGGTVGPTAVYYAGVTAPIISAGMGVVMKASLQTLGLSDYWQWFISAMVSAFAGIAWYLIFIRWSYRHKVGRGTEISLETTVEADSDGITVTRGAIVTRIGWQAVEEVTRGRGHVAITIDGADALIIPDAWFAKDKSARKAFETKVRALNEKAGADGP